MSEANTMGEYSMSLQKIDKELSDLRTMLQSLLPQDPQYISVLCALADWFDDRFRLSGDVADIDEAVKHGKNAMLCCPGDSTCRVACLAILGTCLSRRYEHCGDILDVNEAIRVQREAIRLAPLEDADRPLFHHYLGSSYRRRFERAGNLVDLDKAICNEQEVIRMRHSHPDKGMHLGNLASLLTLRYKRLGRLSDLTDSISLREQVIAKMDDGHSNKSALLGNLAVSFRLLYERSGNHSDIDKSIELHEQAISLPPVDDSRKAMLLNYLGNAYLSRFDNVDNVLDIKKAISFQRAATELTSSNHPDMAIYQDSLGTSFTRLFGKSGDLSDFVRARAAHQKALELTPTGHASRPAYLNNLGTLLLLRFERLGDIADIDQALSLHSQAAELCPNDHQAKGQTLGSLGGSLIRRFERSGDLEDIDRATGHLREAIGLLPADHAEIPKILANLGSSYVRRFQRLNNRPDIDNAIDHQDKVVRLTSDDDARMSRCLNNLGLSLRLRFTRYGDRLDLDKAIKQQKRAVALHTGGNVERAIYLNNLGESFASRFKELGRLSDNDEAISSLQAAAELVSEDNPNKPGYFTNLGGSFLQRFVCLEHPEDIDKAITFRQKAIDLTPDDHADKPGLFENLGNTFLGQYQHSKNACHLESAISSFEHGVDSKSAPPSILFRCARDWARCFHLRYGTRILEAYATIMGLVPRIIWLGTNISRRFEDILSLGDAINEAAAAAIELMKPDLALEWMEQGRSIVWGQILRLRTPFDDLKVSRPDLALDLEDLVQQLELAGHAQSSVRYSENVEKTKASLEAEAQNHRRLAKAYEELIRKVQQIPGFERFLQPKQLHELRGATRLGPVVFINVYKTRCDALILQDITSPVCHIPLRTLTHNNALEMYQKICIAVQQEDVRKQGGRAYDRNARVNETFYWPNAALAEMPSILKTLWECVVHPVLSGLRIMESRTGEASLPHITWCATGPLAFLPLHAAGCYTGSDQRKVFQYIVSSYTPSLTALAKSFEKTPVSAPTILAVSQPATPRQPKLIETVAEVQAIKDCVGELNWLNGEKATVAAVLEAMEECNWCHLACHGIQHPEDPMRSAFALYDDDLNLQTIMSKRFQWAQIAFLSACQTATGDERRPEEAVHLAAGMLMAGFKTVFATMWSIKDEDGPMIAKEVYTFLLKNKEMEGGTKATALHHAVGALRKDIGEDAFVRWVPFIHLGA